MRLSDQQEQRGGDSKIDRPVEPVSQPFVPQEAEQVKVPLVGVREAVEKDHKQRR
jgi:hypothetical protein